MSENKFQIGDRIRVVNAQETWLDQGSNLDTIFTAVEENGNACFSFCPDTNEVNLHTLNDWPNDFELVERPVLSLPEQELTHVTLPLHHPDPKEVITPMTRDKSEDVFIPISVANDTAEFHTGGTLKGAHTLVGEAGTDFVITRERAEQLGIIKKTTPLGVHRPALEDRKVGKVGMHMVIDGFPRALREVARVMTWAGEVKGYKLNDWVNLPNAEIEFPAAEYRHQNDNSIMKSEGTPAIERTDHESNLLHAAHKVFNSLAELELILQGKIK
jgi:hypothetical protein